MPPEALLLTSLGGTPTRAHFTDGETEAQQCSNLPKVIEQAAIEQGYRAGLHNPGTLGAGLTSLRPQLSCCFTPSSSSPAPHHVGFCTHTFVRTPFTQALLPRVPHPFCPRHWQPQNLPSQLPLSCILTPDSHHC